MPANLARIPPQLEKTHVVPTSWQDEALARDGVSREVPCSALKALQSYLTLCDPMDGSLPGSSVYGILQARILEWVAIPPSRESSRPRD